MNPTEYIQKYGGKAGGFFFLRDLGGFEKHLPPLIAYLDRDQDFSAIADKIPECFPTVIVRGTHPNDNEGLVDILHTVPGISHKDALEAAVDEIRDRAKWLSVFNYNEYEGQEYDGNVGILIQEQCSKASGSIVEHPHKRGIYIIDFVDIATDNERVIEHYVVDQREIGKPDYSLFNINDRVLRKIIELYKKFQKSGFIPEDYSFQMEFGLKGSSLSPEKELVLFYQARPFKRFEEPPFRLKKRRQYECYGTTPKKGIVFPVVKTSHEIGVNNVQEPFAWIIQGMTHKMSPNCQPRNMKVFLPLGRRVNSLEHNTYRWIRKADISIVSPDISHILDEFQTGDNIRIRSNGICFEVGRE